MLFNQNLISAGRLSPSSSLQGIMGDLYRGTRTKRSMGGISSSGIAIDIPNLVATGEFIKEIDVRHEWLCEQDWCSHSSKFPGFSVVYPGTSFLPLTAFSWMLWDWFVRYRPHPFQPNHGINPNSFGHRNTRVRDARNLSITEDASSPSVHHPRS